MPVTLPVMSVAHAARSIAQQLIPEYHPHLLLANILYLFTDQRRKRCDRVRLGSAAKMSSLQRFLASGMDGVEQGPDFLMLIDSNEWDELSKTQREALVDHELCHMGLWVNNSHPPDWQRWIPGEMDDPQDYADQKFGLRGHDIEEFGEVLARHGFWRSDPQERRFFEVVNLQLKMPESNGTAPKPSKAKRDRQEAT